MERRSTAVPDIRNAVARDRHNGLCASLPWEKRASLMAADMV